MSGVQKTVLPMTRHLTLRIITSLMQVITTPSYPRLYSVLQGVLGLCAGAGTECLVLLGVSAGLLVTLMVTICVSCVCVRKQKQEVSMS